MNILVAVLITIAGFLAQGQTINLTADNHVLLRNEIDDTTISKLQVDLAKVVSKRGVKTYTIYLVLDSPGGSIDSGLNFIEFAKNIPNLETITLFSASMASAIVEALPGKRNITDTGILMFHRARGGVEGQFEDGELESRLELYKKMVRKMEIVNSSRMKMSLEAYKAKVKDELWILGSESIKQNAADAVVSVSCSQQLIDTKTVETFLFMGMIPIDVEFSDCPLIKAGAAVDTEQKTIYNQYKKTRMGYKNEN